MDLPKRPNTPSLNEMDFNHITEVVFGKTEKIEPCDAIFIFGGSHPGSWLTTIDLYKNGIAPLILATGGFKRTANRHSTWTYGDTPESVIIKNHLINNGIPNDCIFIENQSTNSYENVHYMRSTIEKKNINSVVLVCKCYGVGRQLRTFKNFFPNIKTYVCGFDTDIDKNGLINKFNWKNNEEWKSLIFGEYIRNVFYGIKGDILNDIKIPESLKAHLATFLPLGYIA